MPFLGRTLGRGPTKINIHTCEHMILGQLRMGARQAKNAPLLTLTLLPLLSLFNQL